MPLCPHADIEDPLWLGYATCSPERLQYLNLLIMLIYVHTYDPIPLAVLDIISSQNFFQSGGKCLFVLICILLTITEFFLSIVHLCFWIICFFLHASFCWVFFFHSDLYILWMIIFCYVLSYNHCNISL